MKVAERLQQMSMDFYDLAHIAKAKGNPEQFDEYMKSAYLLSKEAALKIQSDPEDSYHKSMFARSAGWIAFKLDKIEEAEIFVGIGLDAKPSDYEKAKLLELNEAIKKHPNHTKSNKYGDAHKQHLLGFMASTNKALGNIVIQELEEGNLMAISVPKELISNVSRSYIGEPVEIEFVKNEDGTSVLKHIKRAA